MCKRMQERLCRTTAMLAVLPFDLAHRGSFQCSNEIICSCQIFVNASTNQAVYAIGCISCVIICNMDMRYVSYHPKFFAGLNQASWFVCGQLGVRIACSITMIQSAILCVCVRACACVIYVVITSLGCCFHLSFWLEVTTQKSEVNNNIGLLFSPCGWRDRRKKAKSPHTASIGVYGASLRSSGEKPGMIIKPVLGSSQHRLLVSGF